MVAALPQSYCECSVQDAPIKTSISANADGLCDAALRKIDHIGLHAECTHQAASVASNI